MGARDWGRVGAGMERRAALLLVAAQRTRAPSSRPCAATRSKKRRTSGMAPARATISPSAADDSHMKGVAVAVGAVLPSTPCMVEGDGRGY